MKKFLLFVSCCFLLSGCAAPKNEDKSLGFDTIKNQCQSVDKDMSCYEEALRAAQKEGRLKDGADILAFIGYHYEEIGDKKRAIVAFQKSLEIHKAEGFIEKYESIFHPASINSRLAEMNFPSKEAVPYYNEVLEIDREEERYEMYKFTLSNILLIYDAENSTFQEIQKYIQELEAKNNTFQKGLSFKMAGQIYGKRGNIDYALEFYKQALPFLNRENRLFTGVLSQLSEFEFSNGNCSAALSHINQARTIFKEFEKNGVNEKYEFDETRFHKLFLETEANCSFLLGDYAKALQLYKENARIFKEGTVSFRVDPVFLIVMTHLAMGDNLEAKKYLLQDRKEILANILSLDYIFHLHQKEDVWKALLTNALKIFDVPSEQIDIYAELAKLSENQGQIEEEKYYYEKALKISQVSGNDRAIKELQKRLTDLIE